ncbi:fibroblast growth factor 19 [Pseudochaenichthys georgianus]|uniref:Uncharacterized protein n=1 Tax=Chaenocephalus aceratus TaxID=36190 RepID=A0ACB9XQK3_CHAAC|nr:fibroblast growth factor 19 [Pseudochaenichthys georgianus]KAI4829732.1 hypothetical protein KUCAC02_001405 [Chaenocephalus aceratus]
MLLLVVSVSLTNMFLAVGVVCVPLPEQGPPTSHHWGPVVRLRHLYAARPGLHLLISGDGQVHGSEQQTPHSLLEISPVEPGCVVIRGVAASTYLCIEPDGRLYSTPTYSRDSCTFREQILPDGYSVYTSVTHGALLSLGTPRQRKQGRDRGMPALAQFLPRISSLDQVPDPGPDVPEQLEQRRPTEDPVDAMDLFGQLSQIMHSPSFHKR